MYLLVDSGSSKADWVLFDNQTSDFFTTEGINPSIQNAEDIQNQIATAFALINRQPEKIVYYGAGTSSETAKNELISNFKHFSPDSEITIFSDLLAAGRALCQGQQAIICILGTGSHAALCDGHKIIHQLPALGYLLGDEGSGNHLGKEILKSYYYNNLDSVLKSAFEIKFPEVLSDFIYQLYHTSNPASSLANFGQFVVENKKHPICYQIILDCFESFINTKLKPYKENSQLPVHLCGSVGFYLKDEFSLCLRSFGFKMGDCIQRPIHQLLEYHRGELIVKNEIV